MNGGVVPVCDSRLKCTIEQSPKRPAYSIRTSSSNRLGLEECQLRRRSLLFSVLSSQLATHFVFPSEGRCQDASYDSYADTYDDVDSGNLPAMLGLTELRKELCSKAFGDVLEVGVGTGLNIEWYSPNKVTSLKGLDVSKGMLNVARERISAQGWSNWVELVEGDSSKLPFDDNRFDTVLDTYSLCVFPDPLASLSEMSRVVKKNGRVLLLEHTRSPNPVLGIYQDIVADPVASMSKGCVWNQDVVRMLKKVGLEPYRVVDRLGGLVSLIEARPRK